MAEDPQGDWSHGPWLRIGRGLLVIVASGPESATASMLGGATGRDQSNVKKDAEDMVAAGLLVPAEPPARAPGRGRPAKTAYAFAAGQKARLESHLQAAGGPGLVRFAQQLVFAEARPDQTTELMQTLGDPAVMARATWAALCDGERQEYVLVFDGDDPASDAVDLIGALSAASIRARRASVAQVSPIHTLVNQAQRLTGTS